MAEDGSIEQHGVDLRERIRNGEFGTHGRLPAVAQLAREWGISRPSVYAVMNLLQSEGLVTSKANSFYANFPLLKLEGLTENFERFLQAQGFEVTMENLIEPVIETMPEDVAAFFGEAEGVRVVHRMRKQGIQDLPLRIAENWYPVHLAGQFVDAMKSDEHMDVLRAIKNAHGVFIVNIQDVLLARIPTVQETKWLGIVRTEPIVEIRRSNFAEDGTPVMFNRVIHVAPHFKFTYQYSKNHWNK
jgi:DNA-binding GntR family transcriptional regulator